MCEWEGKVWKDYWTRFLGIFGAITVLLIVLAGSGVGDVLGCFVEAYILMFVLGFAIYFHGLRDVHEHDFSRWDMDMEVVCRRIDMAIRARGTFATAQTKGRNVVFSSPPLSIVVRPGRKWTTVFVGPLNPETRERAEALKAFVDAALGKRPRRA